MKATVHRRRKARQDLVNSFRHYAREAGLGVARGFLTEAKDTFCRLTDFTALGRQYQPESPELASLRFFPVSRFREHLVFYRAVTSGIEIVRVLHSARDIDSILASDLDLPDGNQDPTPAAPA